MATFLILVAIPGRLSQALPCLVNPINRLAIVWGFHGRGRIFVGVSSASGVLSKPLEAAIMDYRDYLLAPLVTPRFSRGSAV